MKKESGYEKSAINSRIFGVKKMTREDLFKSTLYFLTREYIKDGYTFLDIGGGGGTL